MDNALEIVGWELKKGSSVILRWRNKMIVTNVIKDRSQFNPSDGTFRINDLNRNDSGQYNLIYSDSNGIKLSEQTLQLFIEGKIFFSTPGKLSHIDRSKSQIVLICVQTKIF